MGMAVGYITTGLLICPAIFADWLYKNLQHSFNLSPHENQPQCDIRIYDIPHLIHYEEIKSTSIYQGGFFTASKPLKVFAEMTGTIVNAMVAASVFVLVGILEIALITTAMPLLILLGVAAIFAGGIYCLVQSYEKGFQKQCIDTINYLSENLP